MTADPTVAPAWFAASLAATPESHVLTVDRVDIAYLAWGRPGDPVLVLVHGGAAHAHWWSSLAPLLAEEHRVVAVDLSGHGDSAHRERYRAEWWAQEVVAVAEHERVGPRRPVVVGHSMGGFVTVVAAARHGAALDGAIVLDAPIRRPDPETEEAGRRGRSMFRQPKAYPDLATGMEHFHLVPPQPEAEPWLLREVARHSLRRFDDGRWRWKFDPRVFVERTGPSRPSDYAEDLTRAACRLAIVNGARSAIVDDEVIAHMRELVAGSPAAAAGVPFVKVPEAHHHLLLDQPLATVTALRAVLATWHPVGAPPPSVLTTGG
ncbi:alpha/beta fold hydrolase [Egicoccus halophilus]|uniref:Alpha/beta hydrolase n=1 Tax=Egicoccus halophilus TaxID=1670830 RepID=A0A8J3AB65_9ACTN|nr:alpha/beta hydrolase [Egicoccus halophilus]GGI09599.1 alpha/beta hydrolase [Egicoccus halophilus]